MKKTIITILMTACVVGTSMAQSTDKAKKAESKPIMKQTHKKNLKPPKSANSYYMPVTPKTAPPKNKGKQK